VRNPRDFAKPLAVGAPDPILDIPFRPSRMIHFFDASNEKMAAKVPDMAKQADILLGNLEDAVPVDRKEAAREGLVKVGQASTASTRPGSSTTCCAWSARSATSST
jgi:malyl-CoA/(S)-citramalyl-CoA lyase